MLEPDLEITSIYTDLRLLKFEASSRSTIFVWGGSVIVKRLVVFSQPASQRNSKPISIFLTISPDEEYKLLRHNSSLSVWKVTQTVRNASFIHYKWILRRLEMSIFSNHVLFLEIRCHADNLGYLLQCPTDPFTICEPKINQGSHGGFFEAPNLWKGRSG